MSDDEDEYSYEYDDDMDEDTFEYTDEEEEAEDEDSAGLLHVPDDDESVIKISTDWVLSSFGFVVRLKESQIQTQNKNWEKILVQ